MKNSTPYYNGGKFKKLCAQNLLSISILIISLLITSTTIVQASTDTGVSNVTVKRISGNDRYSTSIAISKEGWDHSDYAILTSGENYPDALSAAPLAKKYNCPIILTSKYSLSDDITAELKRLSVKEVLVLGGSGVISNNIDIQLSSINIKVTRIAGTDRYETSSKIAENLGTNDEIFIASGEDFADALSAAPIASIKNIPVLLSPKDNLNKNIANFINGKSIYKSYVVGATNSLSENVLNSVANFNGERIDGTDKYDRNINVINKFKDQINFNTIFIASGNDFPDSLSGCALASKTNSPVILVNNNNIDKVKNLIKDKDIKNIVILGGEGAVLNSVKEDLVNSLDTSTAKVVTVSNSKELMQNIAPNTKIVLKSGDYNLLEPKVLDNKYIQYNQVFDGYELLIKDVNNFTIEADQGSKVNLLIDPRYAYVMHFVNSNKINISGIVAGHYPEKGECVGGVFRFEDCKDIQIDNSELFGCGTEGLTLDNVDNLQLTSSTIRDCSYGIMTINNSTNINFDNSTFKDNKEYYLINIVHSDANFEKCTITNNRIFSDDSNNLFNLDIYSKVSVSDSTIENNAAKNLTNEKDNTTFKNVTFKGNDFDNK
jgi:Putative cell wall-binding domain